MKRPDDETRLRHMLDAARTAIEFAGGRTGNDLITDKMLDLSLTRLLEILGEAAKGVSPDFRQRFPEVPWNQVVGIRNILTHAYFDIDLEIIWSVVAEDLPLLVKQLEDMLSAESKDAHP